MGLGLGLARETLPEAPWPDPPGPELERWSQPPLASRKELQGVFLCAYRGELARQRRLARGGQVVASHQAAMDDVVARCSAEVSPALQKSSSEASRFQPSGTGGARVR